MCSCKRSNCNSCCERPEMTDCLAQQIECIFKQEFCDAQILPQIGYPSCNNCVATITHSVSSCGKNKIDGLTTNSLLVNNAFYSGEVSDCKYVNLYSISIPDIPGECGCKSSGEIYTEALGKFGISVDGSGYNWKGACPHTISVHSKAIGMHPCEFAKYQVASLRAVRKYYSGNNSCKKSCKKSCCC